MCPVAPPVSVTSRICDSVYSFELQVCCLQMISEVQYVDLAFSRQHSYVPGSRAPPGKVNNEFTLD